MTRSTMKTGGLRVLDLSEIKSVSGGTDTRVDRLPIGKDELENGYTENDRTNALVGYLKMKGQKTGTIKGC